MNRYGAWSAGAMAACLAAVALAGCGGARAIPPAAPPADAAPSGMAGSDEGALGSIDEAIAQLERAEGELDQALGRPLDRERSATPRPVAQAEAADEAAPEAPAAAAPAPPPAAPSPPAGVTPKATSTGRQAPQAEGAIAARKTEAPAPKPAAPCETACRALASMERAAEHLCGLAGDSDVRCDSARRRVQDATARVDAQCPRCAAR